MSVYTDLQAWANATLVGLGLVASTSVRERKRLVRLTDDPNPVILHSIGDDELAGRQTGGNVWITYPLYVAYVVQDAHIHEDATPDVDTARQAIRDAMFKYRPLGAAGAVFNCVYTSNPPYPTDASFGAGFDASLQLFTYTSAETLPTE